MKKRFRGLGNVSSSGEVQVLTEGTDASRITAIQNSPRWGVTSNCFTTQNRETSDPNTIYNDFNQTRVVTQADANLLERTKSEAIRALDLYNTAVITAQDKWVSLAEEYAEIAAECNAGTRNYDKQGTGIAIAVHATGLDGRAADCIIAETGKLQGTKRVDAMRALDEVSRKRENAFRLCDFLMVNAHKRADAQKICASKRAAFEKNRLLLDKVGEANRKMDDIRSNAHSVLSRSVSDLQQLFEAIKQLIMALIQAIQLLLEAIQQLAISGAKLAAKLTGFFIEHPNLLLGVSGAVAIILLLIILRPYITILSAIF